MEFLAYVNKKYTNNSSKARMQEMELYYCTVFMLYVKR